MSTVPGKLCVSPIVSGKKQNANSRDRRESGNTAKKYNNMLKYKYTDGFKNKYRCANADTNTNMCHQLSAGKSKMQIVKIGGNQATLQQRNTIIY